MQYMDMLKTEFASGSGKDIMEWNEIEKNPPTWMQL